MDRQRIVRIPESRISDSGDYTCLVENNDLESDTAIVRLNVVAAPSFEQEVYEPHVTVIEGEKLVLSCTARGNPQPKVRKNLFLPLSSFFTADSNMLLSYRRAH